MPKTDNPAEVGKHKFELAGLGLAPFRYVGMSENVFQNGDGTSRAGGSCDYCATGIRFEFHILSADGKRSKVGCNCIEKVGDAGLMRAYKSSPEYRKHQRDLRHAKDRAVSEELAALLAAVAEELRALPHPRGFIDYRTGVPMTRLDYYNYMMGCCGASGRKGLLKSLKLEFPGYVNPRSEKP